MVQKQNELAAGAGSEPCRIESWVLGLLRVAAMREPTLDELEVALEITERGTMVLLESEIPDSHESIQARQRIAGRFREMIIVAQERSK